MKKNEYYYKVEFAITNLPHEEDFLDVKEFDSDYLLHSKAFAKDEFERICSLIQQGALVRNLEDSSYGKASFDVSLYLVRRSQQNEQNYFLQSLEEMDRKNQKNEKTVLNKEYLKVQREFKAGYLRHKTPIYKKFFFRIKVHKTESNGPNGIDVTEYKISGGNSPGYELFKDALETASGNFDYLWASRINYDGEKGDGIQVQLFLVERTDYGEEERLLSYNNKKYPLEKPFILELSEKANMEYYARCTGQELKFGIKSMLWDEEKIMNFQKPGEAEKFSSQLTDDFYQKLKDQIRIWNSINYYYIVFEGKDWRIPKNRRFFLHHNLQYMQKDAKDFYHDLIYDQTAGMDSSANLPEVSLILIRKDNIDPLYIRTTDPSKEQFVVAGIREEKELFESLGYSLDDDDHFPHLQP